MLNNNLTKLKHKKRPIILYIYIYIHKRIIIIHIVHSTYR
jgi:hypothetical protein